MSTNLRVPTRVQLAALGLATALVAANGCSSDSHSEDADADAAPSAQRTDASTRTAGHAATDAGSSELLPAAFKGYELYAWNDQGEVAYTLITGTNRQKTLAEITAPEPAMQDAGGWVAIHGEGLGALERLLARVPAGSEVILTALDGLTPLSAAQRQAVVDLLNS
jgi:hypothetical protein